MAEKVSKKEPEQRSSDFVEVVLQDKHTHKGKECQKGEKITIRKRQLQKMREWGKVK
jgi:hypothetical protein